MNNKQITEKILKEAFHSFGKRVALDNDFLDGKNIRLIVEKAISLALKEKDKKFDDLHNDFLKMSNLCGKAQEKLKERNTEIKKVVDEMLKKMPESDEFDAMEKWEKELKQKLGVGK